MTKQSKNKEALEAAEQVETQATETAAAVEPSGNADATKPAVYQLLRNYKGHQCGETFTEEHAKALELDKTYFTQIG